MPFKTSFLDHWEFALEPAAHANNMIIERLDHEHFVGEILAEIRNRIDENTQRHEKFIEIGIQLLSMDATEAATLATGVGGAWFVAPEVPGACDCSSEYFVTDPRRWYRLRRGCDCCPWNY